MRIKKSVLTIPYETRFTSTINGPRPFEKANELRAALKRVIEQIKKKPKMPKYDD